MASSPEKQSFADLEGYLDVEEREQRRVEFRNLARLCREIFKHRRPFLIGCALILVGTAATLLEPRLFGFAIDDAIVPKRWDRLQQLSLLYLVLVIVRVIATIAQSYAFELLGQRVTQDLRCQLFSHLERLPISVYDKNPAGRLLTRVTNDVESLNEMFAAGFVSMIGNALMVLGILVWLVALNWKLGLISASVFPVLVILSAHFSARLRVAYRDARSKLSALNAFLAENIMGMKVVHLFNRQDLHLKRFGRINGWYADAQVASIRVFAMFQPSITLAAGISMALVIWFGGLSARSGAIQLGVLVAYFSYVLSLFQPLRELADKWNVFLSGMASAERIFAILAWRTELEPEALLQPPKAAPELRGHIVFENVWFAYEGEHWVLKDFSLEIPPGSRLGIVGHTGSGKTTLISLLLRFYEPQKGRILLDGRDLREYDRRTLRSAIGIVQQDAFLFSGSASDNIGFWADEAKVLKTLPAEVKKMLSGWERTAIEERGANLSMGQKQVLAFSRALASCPQIWILDEATANMDSGSEESLQGALDGSAEGRTCLLIAHRLATVREADQIIVIHKGVLLEKGTHLSLLQSGGLYARLYRYQEAQQLAAEV